MRIVNIVVATSLCIAPMVLTAQESSHHEHHMADADHSPSSKSSGNASLSDEQRAQYLNGEGMGMAKAAELNHYPGPRHVLDMADQLGLSPGFLESTRALYQEVHEKAAALGRQIVAREDELNALFRDQRADVEKVKQMTAEIATLQGQLRALHLTTHIRERALLTPEQIAKYDALRSHVPGQKFATMHNQ